jgi:hypothetical protein
MREKLFGRGTEGVKRKLEYHSKIEQGWILRTDRASSTCLPLSFLASVNPICFHRPTSSALHLSTSSVGGWVGATSKPLPSSSTPARCKGRGRRRGIRKREGKGTRRRRGEFEGREGGGGEGKLRL